MVSSVIWPCMNLPLCCDLVIWKLNVVRYSFSLVKAYTQYAVSVHAWHPPSAATVNGMVSCKLDWR